MMHITTVGIGTTRTKIPVQFVLIQPSQHPANTHCKTAAHAKADEMPFKNDDISTTPTLKTLSTLNTSYAIPNQILSILIR